MNALADLLLVLAICLAAVLVLVIVPWCVMAGRELGETRARHRHRPQIPHLEPRAAPGPPAPTDTAVDLPPLPCLQEAWVRETLAMIEERSA